jgi:hypothetical protein
VATIYKNITRFDNLAFNKYKELNQNSESYSFSFLNKERYGSLKPFEATINMKIGSQVDAILTNPSELDFGCISYPIAKSIAHEINLMYGDLIKVFQKQVSFFGEIEHLNHTMKTNGRLDFLIPKHAVIDLKVTMSNDVRVLIEYMNYKEQVIHYAKLADVKKGFIMIHSIPLKKTFLIEIPIPESSEFWENKVLKFGKF